MWSHRFIQQVSASSTRCADQITRINLRSRFTSILQMDVTAYLMDDLLIDTGFVHASQALLAALPDRPLTAVCCTHHHEDHTGGAGLIQQHHGCPVYLAHPRLRHTEGVDRLLLYRRAWWGAPAPYSPSDYPTTVHGSRRQLMVIPTPGHSATHVALFEEATGTLFTGDLLVSTGASAVLRFENPWDSVTALRRVAALQPRRMLSGHGLATDDPVPLLLRKADRVQQAAEHIMELHAQGLSDPRIVATLFTRGAQRDRLSAWMTGGEFSRLAFVRAVIAHAPRGAQP